MNAVASMVRTSIRATNPTIHTIPKIENTGIATRRGNGCGGLADGDRSKRIAAAKPITENIVSNIAAKTPMALIPYAEAYLTAEATRDRATSTSVPPPRRVRHEDGSCLR